MRGRARLQMGGTWQVTVACHKEWPDHRPETILCDG